MASDVWIASNGYVEAREGILGGTMHRVTALGLVLMDPDWKREVALAHLDLTEASRALVERWRMLAAGLPEAEVPQVAAMIGAKM